MHPKHEELLHAQAGLVAPSISQYSSKAFTARKAGGAHSRAVTLLQGLAEQADSGRFVHPDDGAYLARHKRAVKRDNCVRILAMRAVVRSAISAILRADNEARISVFNRQEYALTDSRDLEGIMRSTMAASDDIIRVSPGNSGGAPGTVRPTHMLLDYPRTGVRPINCISGALADVLSPVLDLAAAVDEVFQRKGYLIAVKQAA